MSVDLVKRLRDVSLTSFPADIGDMTDDAADHIEQLEREVAAANDMLQQQVNKNAETSFALAAEKALADGLHDDLKAVYIHDMPDEAEEPASLFDYRKARGML